MACNNRRSAVAARSSANGMTSIREPEQSSRSLGQDLHGKLEQAQAQCAAVAHRNDELELIIAAARLGFCVLEGETRRLRANSQFKAEFGWAPDAPIDWETLLERMATQDRSGLADAARAALDGGVDFDLLVQAIWPGGATQWLALHGRTVNDGADHRNLILTARNVSGEKRAAASEAAERAAAIEHERRLRSQAEAANRGKDQFLSVFSHELRSPLNAILGWNRILALKRPDDPEVASITPRIEHSARAQLKMVNDLLDLGRIETGKLRIEARPMQLAKVVSATLDLTRPSAAAKGITLQADFEPGSGQLRGDPDRLQQVVTNLLSNALKFTPAGGQVSVSLRNVEGYSELSVEDTGQGIAPELLPHVFDRFRQGDSSITRQTGGLGLGLALVREIVTLHGGTVSASSAGVGHGARFVATFPARQPWRAAEAHSTSSPQSPAMQASLGGLSILVVDDEPDARSVVAETLKLEGATVTVTDSATSAFAKVQETGVHFDIIVTDIGMPQEDGYSLVRRLRSLQSGRQMLAIAVTGYASNSDIEAAMNAGFDLHVPKPLDFNTFVPLVRRLADTGR
jgi:signal transduction histidine kinase/ActR/RegA family two-component response regulator